MKNSFLIIIAAFFIVNLFSACTNTDDDLSPGTELTEVLSEDSPWMVTYFWDKDKDETHKFQSYTFSFDSDGVLKATQFDNIVQVGTWSVHSSSNKLIISMGSADPLEELNDDWLINEFTDTTIKLRDDNDEHLEELYFEKK